MKSCHDLKTIVVVPALPPDGRRNSKGVKKYIEKLCCTHTFSPIYCFARHLVTGVGTIRLLGWLLNDDKVNNVKQL
jgi:hypothetical protein